jgi:hypothetical protein
MGFFDSLKGSAARVVVNPLLGHISTMYESASETIITFTSNHLLKADEINDGDVVAALKQKYDPKKKGLVQEVEQEEGNRITELVFTGSAKASFDTDFEAMLESAKSRTAARTGRQPG